MDKLLAATSPHSTHSVASREENHVISYCSPDKNQGVTHVQLVHTGTQTTASWPPDLGYPLTPRIFPHRNSQSETSPARSDAPQDYPTSIETHFPSNQCRPRVFEQKGASPPPSPTSGVETMEFRPKKHYKVHRFYVGNIGPEEDERSLCQHLQDNGINPTFVRMFYNSKNSGVLGAQVNVHPQDSQYMESSRLWPDRTYARPWVPKGNK